MFECECLSVMCECDVYVCVCVVSCNCLHVWGFQYLSSSSVTQESLWRGCGLGASQGTSDWTVRSGRN